MKKTFTLFCFLSAITLVGVVPVNAQIQDLDVTKYYQIINRVSGNVIGVDENNLMIDGALVQQQANDLSEKQLWEVRMVTESSYQFINKATGMALGLTDWRGNGNPFWEGGDDTSDEQKDAQLTLPGFSWNGNHKGACQRAFVEDEETQIWEPTNFPEETSSGDTVFYRMTMAMHLADSGLCFNVWERRTLEGYRNIAVFPGVLEESGYLDATSLYAFYFNATSIEVETTSISDLYDAGINIYSGQNNIVVKGEIQGQVIEVYSILGTLIYKDVSSATELSIPSDRGTYIIKVGGYVNKLVVY